MKSLAIYLTVVTIALWFASQVLYPASQTLTHGFGAYYSAARLLKTGQLSAQVYDPAYFRPVVKADSHQQADDIYNANPPTTALMFWPLSFFSIESARRVWTWVNALMLFGGLTLLFFTFADPSRGSILAMLFGLGMLFQPVIENIRFGQAYLLIFLLLALALLAFHKKQAPLGGVALALALILKTTGWILLPLLAWQRRWTYLAWTLGSVGFILILTWPLFPLSMWQSYGQLLQETINSPQSGVPAYQTTRSLLLRLFVFDPTWNNAPLLNLPWLASLVLVGLAGLTLVANFELARLNPTLAFIATIAWGVIFAPLGEAYHHTVMLIPLSGLIINWQKSHRISQAVLLIIICLYLLPLSLLQPKAPNGWWILLAYPRVYAAWLTLAALYLEMTLASRPQPSPKPSTPAPVPKTF